MLGPSLSRAQRAWLFVGAAAAIAICARITFTSGRGADYANPNCRGFRCNDPAAAIDALAAGDLGRFFGVQPPMGSFSLVLRAPLAALSGAIGDGDVVLDYQLGALACLLFAAGLAVWLLHLLERAGQPWWLRAVVSAGVLVNPVTARAVYWGHPEEVTAGALCTAAVLLAARGRPGWAGAALAAATATKPWAALAVVPVLIASGQVRSVLRVAVPVGALFFLPMAIGDPGRFVEANRSVALAATFPGSVTAANVWWIFSSIEPDYRIAVEGGRVGGREIRVPIEGYALPESVGRLTHPFVILVALGLCALYWRRRPPGAVAEDVLLLLALIFLLRCVLDPLTYSYHHLPFFFALGAWESLRRRGLPWAAIFAAAALYVTEHYIAGQTQDRVFNIFYLTWALVLAGWMGRTLFLPPILRQTTPGGRDWRPEAAGS